MRQLGRYVVESELGAGAMGVVYVGSDPRLNRRVALKTVRCPDGLDDAVRREFHERFLREARAAAALAHPGIVTVFDADVDPERELPFIAMELVDGRSLADILSREPSLEVERAVEIADALAQALGVAHAAGIVHRDVKPANVLVRDADGVVKVADFGVARIRDSELTGSGKLLGSPSYMSPEQIRGETIDGRSDLFSLAVVLYEMLTGERPFAGEDLAALAYAIAHETPVPVTRRRPGLPGGLDRFFDRALAKRAEDRFETASEWREALAEARTEEVDAGAATVVDRTRPTEPPATGRPLAPIPDLADVPPMLDGDEDRPTDGRSRLWLLAVVGMALAIGGWVVFAHDDAELRLEARNTLASGTLTLSVDDEVVYTRDLAAPGEPEHPGNGKGKGVFGRFNDMITKRNQESFEAWIDVPPGKREITAEVEPGGLRDTIVVDLASGERRTLNLAIGKSFGSPIALDLGRSTRTGATR